MLHPCHLVVVQFHRIDQAATEMIILGIRSEYARQKHTCCTPWGKAREELASSGMNASPEQKRSRFSSVRHGRVCHGVDLISTEAVRNVYSSNLNGAVCLVSRVCRLVSRRAGRRIGRSRADLWCSVVLNGDSKFGETPRLRRLLFSFTPRLRSCAVGNADA